MTWIGWALLSALFAAATALLAKVGVAHVDSNLATAVRTSVVVVFAWGIRCWRCWASQCGEMTRPRPAHLALSCALRAGHRTQLAVLLPRVTARAGLARGPAR